jgi:hypothetical protein
MTNPNKWIPVSECYPPNGAEVQILVEGKAYTAVFHDYEDYRMWETKLAEYNGIVLPTAWRFPDNTIGIVLKVDLENETSRELGI